MKVLFLAIAVLFVAQSQASGYNAKNRYPVEDSIITSSGGRRAQEMSGQEVLALVISTLQQLQHLFEQYQWANLYVYPDLSLPLLN